MSKITDLTVYKNHAYLELCLMLVEEAQLACQKGHYDLVDTQLSDILETFERGEATVETAAGKEDILPFPSCR